ncbi:MAG: response regulator [Anaerolineae bacterium]|nr:response regulator [Anaerolineae bacterium]
MLNESLTPTANSHRCVLIVDDDDDMRLISSEVLTYYGYDPLVAADGMSALTQATLSPPDVALVDLLLPDMSGLEVMLQLKQMYPQLPIIIMTVLDTDEPQLFAQQHGVFAYMLKPIYTSEIVKVVQRALCEI